MSGTTGFVVRLRVLSLVVFWVIVMLPVAVWYPFLVAFSVYVPV